MNQGGVWKKLKSTFLELYPTGHIDRIENLLGRGTPDVTLSTPVSGPACENWVEIKTGYQKPTDPQREWITKRRLAGGNVKVLTVRETKALVELNSGTVVVVEPIDWSRITRLITE